MPTSILKLTIAALVASAAVAAQAACVVSATPMHFGQILLLSGSVSTSFATVTVSCTELLTTTTYTIGIGPSSGAADTSVRYLRNPLGGAPLLYNLYTDSAYSVIWGDGVSSPGVSGSLEGLLSVTRDHTVYGRTLAGQTELLPGEFSDSLLVTLTYNP